MNTQFDTIQKIINNRHTTKPGMMNGEIIDNELINEALKLADKAPTHGRTEPWRFIVFTGEALQQFCFDHATMYWQYADEKVRTTDKFEKLKNQYQNVSHLAIAYMKRSDNAKISMMEEYAATCAAVENVLLGCQALDIAAIWSTGGMTHHSCMLQYLGLNEGDVVVAFLFMGKSHAPIKPIERKISIAEKILWK